MSTYLVAFVVGEFDFVEGRDADEVLIRVYTPKGKAIQGQFALEVNKLIIKQLLDEVEHDIMNYQNRGLCYVPQPSASADNTDLGFDNSGYHAQPRPIIVY